ncbi:nucleotide exchange factor GrpE [Ferrimonas lipolytica]|uniref:Protein GrpE n=1 Tax=Ferrimonas lipolytica TaxID=2724191 RepID=A0A6H1UA45_9GAMM|nr:nucleotide exchange factor GrpE [Ferrimonas lipolytica]QIZ75904.1 nucleotide exchange factor GrpE [Ferrimonas lipolytica]
MSDEQQKVVEQEEIESVEAETVDAELVDERDERIAQLEAELEQARGAIDGEKDIKMRAAAEVDNIRRRSAIDVQKARDFALEKFAKELLPVLDNLERAQDAGDKDSEAAQAILEGVELTHKSFIDSVAKFGIEAVGVEGDAFNPELHQAISMVPSPDHKSNTLMAVMQKGYTLNGRLLRPAMVMVAQ